MELPAPHHGFGRRVAEAAKEYGQHRPPADRWMPWPNQHTLKPGSRNAYRWRINTQREGFPPGYQAKLRNGWLYLRWMGDQQPN